MNPLSRRQFFATAGSIASATVKRTVNFKPLRRARAAIYRLRMVCSASQAVSRLAVVDEEAGAVVALTVAALLSPLSSPGTGRPARPTTGLRIEVNILPIDVIVTAAEGNFMAGLGVEDFELFENGEAREIQIFGLVEVPVPVEATPTEDMAPGWSPTME